MDPIAPAFWSIPEERLLEALRTSRSGLSSEEATRRLERYGPNRLREGAAAGGWALLAAQLRSPITVMLLAAAILSMIVGETTDGAIIFGIVVASMLLDFWQERSAATAVRELLALIRPTTTALRDGRPTEVPVENVVPGDVVQLGAGATVPGDCRILESADLFVDEAALTGESFPVEKAPGTVAAEAPIARRGNALFMGTHVVSGTAVAVVARTGLETEFGRIAERLERRAPETDFERGVRHFGYTLLEITLVLVVFIFAVNVALDRPLLDSLLFTLALAVGLTPQLLPAIASVTLARGARRMAARKVIVKRLAAIENFGSMGVLCTDKTGTLTAGTTRVHSGWGADGAKREKVLFYAFLNASLQSGFPNPIDRAVRAQPNFSLDGWRKVGEVPYDFARKRLSVVVEHEGVRLMVTKGALREILAICATVERADGSVRPLAEARATVEKTFESLSAQGLRCLGVAWRELGPDAPIDKGDERDMTFVGILALEDPIKEGVSDSLRRLAELGIAVKLVTGDNHLVARRVAGEVGLRTARVLTSSDLRTMSDAALRRTVHDVDVFAEIEPVQKERIILALKRENYAVGYLGDGVNDAPALHAADVGISVDSAVDVTKNAAAIVLLEKDLRVLIDGVCEGRRAFGNTLKYIFITTSANFGNMFSMAGASLITPFLPLLPQQILLINVLTDLPALAIATDRLDAELLREPRRWDIRVIRRFMLTFGPVSSAFDYLTFGALLWLGASVTSFRTGWFLESVLSEILILLVIRTRRPFFRSAPSRPLVAASAGVAVLTLGIAFSPVGRFVGLAPIPWSLMLLLFGIVAAYVVASEFTKSFFFRHLVPREEPPA